MHNSFGSRFKITLFGASHAPETGVHIDGIPAGIAISEEDFEEDLSARRAGAAGTTPRTERDIPHIGGLSNGRTDGGRVTVTFRNENIRSHDYSCFDEHPRPSHADFVARRRYGKNEDLAGGGIFSGRMTVGIVAAGVAAKKVLPEGVRFSTRITEIGGCGNSQEFDDIIARAAADGDSVGGVIECCAEGLPLGLGEPFFDSVESVMAHILFSIPAVKGVEFGSGFSGAALRGSQRNDRIINADGTTATNNEGGINGGLTNGNPMVVRVAVKPAASIGAEQQTYHFGHGAIEPLTIGGRHDVCIALRARIVIEAAVAISLADLYLQH